jgi:XapX domain-containing protein
VKIILGLILALVIGVVCRVAGIPVPAPPAIVGALLGLAMTAGYLLADRFVQRPAEHKKYCGGPTGASASKQENEP